MPGKVDGGSLPGEQDFFIPDVGNPKPYEVTVPPARDYKKGW